MGAGENLFQSLENAAPEFTQETLRSREALDQATLAGALGQAKLGEQASELARQLLYERLDLAIQRFADQLS